MTQLRVVDVPTGSWWDAEPGDVWPCAFDRHAIEGRPPCWVIRLPGVAFVFHTNERATDPPHEFWEIEGEPPALTVRPSVNIGPEIWHGTITDGVMNP